MPDTSAPTVSAASAAQIAPARVGSALRVLAWLNFVGNVLIIATGGAVRLTGSGLGCPTWPLCTPDSLVPTPALVDESIHSLIEYGNRMMSPLLGILALVLLILVWRVRAQRRDGACGRSAAICSCSRGS